MYQKSCEKKIKLAKVIFAGIFASILLHACVQSSQGPLRVSSKNSRYFTNESGRAILLTGSHTWNNLVDMGPTDPPKSFDYSAYLKWMQSYGHNFMRLWAWELTDWSTVMASPATWGREVEVHSVAPHPWARTGPGLAQDGNPKFDLDSFNVNYFDRLRSRVEAAADHGIYVSIMLFEGWCLQFVPNGYNSHPFHPLNNIEELSGIANKEDSLAVGIHAFQNDRISAIQEAYVKRVIDVVNDLDNVLYEISNENHPGSTSWQYHMIELIHLYENTKPKQHPVGMTFQYKDGSNEDLFKSPAEWISPNGDGGYKDDPPESDGSKIIITDTDHLWGIGGTSSWAWKSFCRGLNPIFMDPYDGLIIGKSFDAQFEPLRVSLGQIQQISGRLNLIDMVPQSSLATSNYCLAQLGQQYLIYLAETNMVTVDLTALQGAAGVEWFNPGTGVTKKVANIKGGGIQDFESPFAEEGVVLLIERL